LTESLPKPKGHVFNNKLMIYCQQMLTILGLIYSSQLDLLPCECSLSEVSDSPLYEFVRRHCWNRPIVVKYNKNIRCVEWMTSHPLQNAFSLNWVHLMAAVKLANKNRKRWTNFALKFGKNIKQTLYFWIMKNTPSELSWIESLVCIHLQA
jgi:hypothetical protein